MKKDKFAEEGEHENTERWLLTYADMITLLVCFFIIMYSLSVMNLKKFDKVAIAIRSGFGGKLEGGKGAYIAASGNTHFGEWQGNPVGVTYTEQDKRKLHHIRRQMAVMRLDRVLEPMVAMPLDDGNSFRVVLSDQLFFATGKFDIDPETRRQILTLGQYLKDITPMITVEGYSGQVAAADSVMDSWALSAERARSVINVLIKDCGINPEQLVLKANGERTIYGSSRRLALNHSGEWKELSVNEEKDASPDRVIVWILIG